MCIADFDAKNLKITNPKVIANKEQKPGWYAYPRWTKDGKAVMLWADRDTAWRDVSEGIEELVMKKDSTEK